MQFIRYHIKSVGSSASSTRAPASSAPLLRSSGPCSRPRSTWRETRAVPWTCDPELVPCCAAEVPDAVVGPQRRQQRPHQRRQSLRPLLKDVLGLVVEERPLGELEAAQHGEQRPERTRPQRAAAGADVLAVLGAHDVLREVQRLAQAADDLLREFVHLRLVRGDDGVQGVVRRHALHDGDSLVGHEGRAVVARVGGVVLDVRLPDRAEVEVGLEVGRAVVGLQHRRVVVSADDDVDAGDLLGEAVVVGQVLVRHGDDKVDALGLQDSHLLAGGLDGVLPVQALARVLHVVHDAEEADADGAVGGVRQVLDGVGHRAAQQLLVGELVAVGVQPREVGGERHVHEVLEAEVEFVVAQRREVQADGVVRLDHVLAVELRRPQRRRHRVAGEEHERVGVGLTHGLGDRHHARRATEVDAVDGVLQHLVHVVVRQDVEVGGQVAGLRAASGDDAKREGKRSPDLHSSGGG
ncbi:hypothetical protein ON010_g2364 [Phytophthora cinnamomi]|nr:hypothetical protein ON010_g2364 [Phytophthora cinnamomi]